MSSNRFFQNKSQIRMFEGENLDKVQREVNEFMLTINRIYNVKHQVVIHSDKFHYHYFMVSYE